MFNFRKDTEVNVDTAIETALRQAPPTNDEMLRRDNFFHNCWMMLKYKHQHLIPDMAKIELIIAGYGDPDAQEDENDNNDADKDIIL